MAEQYAAARPSAVLAIVDFATIPLSFDVLNVLAIAELFRRRVKAEVVDIAFVADHADLVFQHAQADHLGVRSDHMTFVHNLGIEGRRLLPEPGSVLVFTNRVEFRRYLRSRANPSWTVPRGYQALGPSYVAARGEPPLYGLRSLLDGKYSRSEPPLLRPDREHVMQMQRWLAANVDSGSYVVTVTIRDSGNSPLRNSSIGEWKKLVDSYKDNGRIRFVIVPDYFKVFQKTGLENRITSVCNEAAISLGLRHALYANASLNLFVGNGPATIAYLDHNIPFLTFKMNTSEPSSRLEEIAFQHALAPGQTLPWFGEDRAIVWADDTFIHMRAAVDAVIKLHDKSNLQ